MMYLAIIFCIIIIIIICGGSGGNNSTGSNHFMDLEDIITYKLANERNKK